MIIVLDEESDFGIDDEEDVLEAVNPLRNFETEERAPEKVEEEDVAAVSVLNKPGC